MSNTYSAIAVGATLGVIIGVCIRLAYKRGSGNRPVEASPGRERDRTALQLLIVAFIGITSVLLTVLGLVGGLVSTLPFALVAIIAGIALTRV